MLLFMLYKVVLTFELVGMEFLSFLSFNFQSQITGRVPVLVLFATQGKQNTTTNTEIILKLQ